MPFGGLRKVLGKVPRVAGLVLLGAMVGLAACRPIAGPAPQAGPAPTLMPETASTAGVATMPEGSTMTEPKFVPEAVTYGEAGEDWALDPTGEIWRAVAGELEQILDDMDAQARTLFDGERYAAEVEPVPHVWMRFEQAHDFAGRNVVWRAQELTLVVVNDEPMLLARGSAAETWSVYLPGDGSRLAAWVAEVAQSVRNE